MLPRQLMLSLAVILSFGVGVVSRAEDADRSEPRTEDSGTDSGTRRLTPRRTAPGRATVRGVSPHESLSTVPGATQVQTQPGAGAEQPGTGTPSVSTGLGASRLRVSEFGTGSPPVSRSVAAGSSTGSPAVMRSVGADAGVSDIGVSRTQSQPASTSPSRKGSTDGGAPRATNADAGTSSSQDGEAAPFVVAAAGDIAGPWPTDERTAQLLDAMKPRAVLALGDLAYGEGTPAQFAGYYEPSWGRHRNITWPAPGNHDHGTAKLAGYCSYFGARVGCRKEGRAYYATDLGEWRLISLDSGYGAPGGPGDPMVEGSPQRQWLREELANNRRACTMVIFHHPRFSSGAHGPDARSRGVWEELYRAGVEVILNGHDHHYERFHPLNPKGERDDARGIVQFIVGTGGAALYPLGPALPVTAARQATSHGVLELSLQPDGLAWAFRPLPGGTPFTDTGRLACR